MARIPLKTIKYPGLNDTYVIPQITSLAPAYTDGTYAVGDLVTYDNNLYRCNTAINTIESWTPGHWTLIPMSIVIKALNAASTRLENRVTVVEDEIEAMETKDKIYSFTINSEGHLIETIERYDSTQTEFHLNEEGRLIVTYE